MGASTYQNARFQVLWPKNPSRIYEKFTLIFYFLVTRLSHCEAVIRRFNQEESAGGEDSAFRQSNW